MFEFVLSDSKDFVIVKGLVVPAGSKVSKGLEFVRPVPSIEIANASFKRLFGVRRKKAVVHEEEEEVHEIVESSDSDTEESYSEASSDEEVGDSDDS